MQARYWVLAVLTAACTNGDNTPATSLVSTATEPPGANCASGGVAVTSGADRNDNGVLDPAEITATSYVCTPKGAAQALVDVHTVAAGSHCPNGGEEIDSGLDTNGNGVLDANEITQTSYVCSGTDGTDGSNGSNAAAELVKVVTEPAGAHCATGGEAIESGPDTNHNNVLDANEVTSTTYLCNATNPTTIEGSVTIQNSVQAAQMIGVRHITGNLVIDATGLTSIDLTSLVTVDGSLQVMNYGGGTLSLPALISVGSALSVGGPRTMVGLDSLATVGGDFSVHTQALAAPHVASVANLAVSGLTSDVSFPELVGVTNIQIASIVPVVVTVPILTTASYLSVDTATLNGPALHDVEYGVFVAVSDVSVPSLAVAGTIQLLSTSLTSFPFGQLTSLSRVSMDNNVNAIVLASSLPALDEIQITNQAAAFDLPNLVSIGTLYVASTSNAAIGLPALQSATQLMIDSNPSLTTLAFPALTSTYYLEITRNGLLPECDAYDLLFTTQSSYYYNIFYNAPC